MALGIDCKKHSTFHHLGSLGRRLKSRYHWTDSIGDLQQAIVYETQALAATPIGDFSRARRFNDLGSSLGSRYGRTDSVGDFEQAITCIQEVIRLTPSDHPNQAEQFYNLANSFGDRYRRTGIRDDRGKQIGLFEKALQSPASRPSSRIISGKAIFQHLYQNRNWERAAKIAQIMFDLLPHLCGRYLRRDDLQYALIQVPGFAAEACSVLLKLNKPHKALQIYSVARSS